MARIARRRARIPALAAALALALGLTAPAAPAAVAAPAPLTNLAHLDFLLDEVTPRADDPAHTTYRLAEDPVLVAPWTYADARDGGTFERVGGGPRDPDTGYWGQGAYNADDIARAAVVYVRHWQQTGADASRESAYDLLRTLTYLQTTQGPNAGNVVLWMQPDGTLNPSAEPVELPDPSDSGSSYWLARTVWALGEATAAFADADAAFADFLTERLDLALAALERDVLTAYGQWDEADGVRVPAWLIVDGADATAEAVLGLAAHVRAHPEATAAASALRRFAEGIAAMSAGTEREWPYRAILPWALSPSIWHAWASTMPAALAAAASVLGDRALAAPAIADAAVFTPTLLTAGGPDNGWNPAPTDRVQIAYGADSRVQSLLAVADLTGSRVFSDLAAMQAAWFFGANRAGADMYVPETGVTYDGLQPDGTVNRNSGAESTIHGLLTALALDARPDVAARATSVTDVVARDGLVFVEAEDAVSTDGEITTPTPAWTGESAWSGDALALTARERAEFDIGTSDERRWIEPVVFSAPDDASTSAWRGGGMLRTSGAPQGVSPAPGMLHPVALGAPVSANRSSVRVDVLRGTLTLDGLLVRPEVSRLALAGPSGRTELVHSSARTPRPVHVEGAGTVRVYDATGTLLRTRGLERGGTVVLPAGGLAIMTE